jgi:hypothetical protein
VYLLVFIENKQPELCALQDFTVQLKQHLLRVKCPPNRDLRSVDTASIQVNVGIVLFV